MTSPVNDSWLALDPDIRLAAVRAMGDTIPSLTSYSEVLLIVGQAIAKERERCQQMHRRAQIAEGCFESVILDLEQWRTVTNRRANPAAWLFEYALLHMERRVRRAIKRFDEEARQPLPSPPGASE